MNTLLYRKLNSSDFEDNNNNSSLGWVIMTWLPCKVNILYSQACIQQTRKDEACVVIQTGDHLLQNEGSAESSQKNFLQLLSFSIKRPPVNM